VSPPVSEIRFQDSTIESRVGETLLEALERHGHAIPNACRTGVCQSCLMRATSGSPPAESQKGLRDTLKSQGYFLACQCRPGEAMEVALPDTAGLSCEGRIAAIDRLGPRILSLRVTAPGFGDYRAGQFLTLINAAGVARSYSIASVPGIDEDIAFQIALLPGGAMSGWLANEAKVGDALTLQGPAGECFYTPGHPEQPLLLVGTGTGLAPLYAIAREALHQGHRGRRDLFHGTLRAEDLYLMDALRAMAEASSEFRYYPCALSGPAPEDVHVGPVDDFALETCGSLKGRRVYLCGASEFVKMMQKKAFLAGASMKEIFADSFVPAAQNASANA